MPQFENLQELPLIIYRRNTVDNQLNDLRNLQAIQSALIRGDVDVTLNNVDFLQPEIITALKINHNKDGPLIANYEPPFRTIGPVQGPDPVTDEDVRDMFEDTLFNGLRFEYIKILGGGGFGAATLWNVHLEGGVTQKVVIKVGLSDNFNSDQEGYWHQRYDGSSHTVQIVDIDHLAREAKNEFKANHPGEPLQFDRGMELKNEDLDALVLEYMCYGDLFGILKKASARRQQFPNRVLWGIWECIVLGLATAAYQPIFKKEDMMFEEELEAAREDGELMYFLDQLEETEVSHDVHFDLEESNILAGKLDDHPFQPAFKLHDLGAFSHQMIDKWNEWATEQYWEVRGPVKPAKITPEQTHQDWDKISTNQTDAFLDFRGPDLRHGNPIAGRYGSWTNVFLGARTMEAAMTLKYISHPFTSQEYTTLDGSFKAKTYGWRLQRPSYQSIDPELRDIICQCLFERPIDRPNLVALLRNVELRKQKGFQETEGDVKRFWNEFLNRPDPAELTQRGIYPDDSWDRFERSWHRRQNLRRSPPPRLPRRAGRQPARFRAWLRRQRNRRGRRAQLDTPPPAAQHIHQPMPHPPRVITSTWAESSEQVQDPRPVNPASREEVSAELVNRQDREEVNVEPAQQYRQPMDHVNQEHADWERARAPRQGPPVPSGRLDQPLPPQTHWPDFSGTHREPSPPPPLTLWPDFSGAYGQPDPPNPPENLNRPTSHGFQRDVSRVQYQPQTYIPSHHPSQASETPNPTQEHGPPGPVSQLAYGPQHALSRSYPADAQPVSHNRAPRPDQRLRSQHAVSENPRSVRSPSMSEPESPTMAPQPVPNLQPQNSGPQSPHVVQSISEPQPFQFPQPRPLPEIPHQRPMQRGEYARQYARHIRSYSQCSSPWGQPWERPPEQDENRRRRPENTQNVQQGEPVQRTWGWSPQPVPTPRRPSATRRAAQQDSRDDGPEESPPGGDNMKTLLATTRSLSEHSTRRRGYPMGSDLTTNPEGDRTQDEHTPKRRRISDESAEESKHRSTSVEVPASSEQDQPEDATPAREILTESVIPRTPTHSNSAASTAGKPPEQKSRPGSNQSRTRPSAIEEQVSSNQRPIPVAIQNMMARTQQLDKRLENREEEDGPE